MRTFLKTLILSLFLLNISCTEQISDTTSDIEVEGETTTTQEIVDVSSKAPEILSKKTPSYSYEVNDTYQIILPYYYSDIEVYETGYLSDPWDFEELERFEDIEGSIFEITLKGTLNTLFYVEEDLTIIKNIEEGLITFEALKSKELSYSEESTIIYEDNDSFILLSNDEEFYIYRIIYDLTNTSYILYTGKISSLNKLSVESNKELSLELLKTAKNLHNKSLLNIEHTIETISDYEKVQPKVITNEVKSVFKPAIKQIKFFMDEEEIVTIKTTNNNSFLNILRANVESVSNIDKFLFAVETKDLDEINSSIKNLSNSNRLYLDIPYSRDNLTIKHVKELYTSTLTMTSIDFTDEVIINNVNIATLSRNDREYYILKMNSNNLIQANYYNKVLNHFIESNPL